MELEILTGGQTEAPVAQLSGNLIMGKILLRSNASAGNPGADHERVSFALCFLFACLSVISVLLLIHAMKLENPGAAGRKSRCRLCQFFGDLSTKGLTVGFELLDIRHKTSFFVKTIKSIDIRDLLR